MFQSLSNIMYCIFFTAEFICITCTLHTL